MIKIFIPALLVALLATGCARIPSRAGTEEPLVGEPLRVLPATGSTVKADILYLLLAAELAGQRRQYGKALDYYLQVVDKVPDAWVAERATRIALYLHDYDKAAQAVVLWMQRAPDSPAALRSALMVALRQGKTDEAVSYLARLLEVTPEGDQGSLLLDVLRFMDREVPKETALAVMEKVSRRFPRSPEVLYAHAMLALWQGQTRLALNQITRALALRPDWEKLRVMQSQLLAQLGEGAKAQAVLLELVRKNPDNLSLRLLYAQLLLQQKVYAEAEKHLRFILRRQPAHPDALYAYALVSLQRGDDRAAEAALKRLLKQPKWRAEAHYYLGRIAFRRGDYAKAVDYFDRIREGRLTFDARMNAAAALARLGKLDEAMRRLEHERDRFPRRRLQIYLIEAEILSDAKRYAKAFDVLSRALADIPAHPDLLYARALVAEQMGDPQQAILDLRAALEKRPDDPNLLNALGYTLLEYGGPLDEARELLEKAIRLKPNDPAVLDSYGWLQYKLGNFSKALEYLKKAYSKSEDLEIAVHIGEVYWALGERELAREMWRKALERFQDDPRAQKFAERLRERLEP